MEIEIHMQENRFKVRPKVTTITDLDLWFSPGQHSESLKAVRQLNLIFCGVFILPTTSNSNHDPYDEWI